jgi:hypothetical protein
MSSAALAGTTGFDSRLRTMTYDTIKAKPTWYAGIQFRSRLEARWAVFFDALGIPWEYEPETFVADDCCSAGRHEYTPDFRLNVADLSRHHHYEQTGRGVFVEVKPTQQSLDSVLPKISCLTDWSGPLSSGIVFLGPPELPWSDAYSPAHPAYTWAEGVCEAMAVFEPGGVRMATNEEVLLSGYSSFGAQWPWSGGVLSAPDVPPAPLCGQVARRKVDPGLAAAYSAARNERFGLYPAA